MEGRTQATRVGWGCEDCGDEGGAGRCERGLGDGRGGSGKIFAGTGAGLETEGWGCYCCRWGYGLREWG